MDNKFLKAMVIMLFLVGVIFYATSIALMPTITILTDVKMSMSFEYLGNASFIASIIGATRIKKDS